ncbi:hypothetical protein TUM17576_43860 [Enterobacter hormaechei]|nr:hypothetical protein TUM17576_43860 [Enterobacter hormaechei]
MRWQHEVYSPCGKTGTVGWEERRKRMATLQSRADIFRDAAHHAYRDVEDDAPIFYSAPVSNGC